MRGVTMRIGKISTFIAQFTCPVVESKTHVAASGLKATPLLSKLIPEHGQAASGSAGTKVFRTIALFGAGASGLLSCTTTAYASDGSEHGSDCPCYPWPHKGILDSHDKASIHRGLQVFQDVCSSCHTMSLVSYRDFVGVACNKEETKAMAAEIEVVDNLNDEGEIFTRPGKLSEHLAQPCANVKAAILANGLSYPPDLNLITQARHNGQNYVFSLLTGYRDHAAGVKIREGVHYNPYIRGGAITMPKMLNDSAVMNMKMAPLQTYEVVGPRCN